MFTAIESATAPEITDCVIVTDAVSPALMEADVADRVNVSELATVVDDDGPEARTPSPNAATTTSAMRLKVNFVICFLSIVVLKTFLSTAGEVNIAS